MKYPVKYNIQTGKLEYLTLRGQQLVRNEVPIAAPAATPAPVTDALRSVPPAGCKKITNIYVDADGKLITEYTQ